jgi:tetratricopeptide (TPR) repeat protein
MMQRRGLRNLLSVTLLLAAAKPTAVWAGAASPSAAAARTTTAATASEAQASEESADALIARANQLFMEQRLGAAADVLVKAYAVAPKSIFLFNIAQAYRKADRVDDALIYYQRFIDVAPKHPLAAEARGLLSTLRLLQSERSHAQRTQTELAAAQERAAQELTEARARYEEAQRKEQQLRAELSTVQKPFYKRPWFWGIVGGAAGAAAIIGGVVGGVIANRPPQTEGGFITITFP